MLAVSAGSAALLRGTRLPLASGPRRGVEREAMHEVDDELREIKREIIESRGLVIKTNNLANALSADIKSIAKRQQGYERRLGWNSATAYVVFVVVVFAALKFAVDARVDAIEATSKHLRDENGRLTQDYDAARQREAERQAAELEAAKFYDLVKQGKRPDLIKGWETMRSRPLSKAEAQFLADAVDKAKNEQAALLYVQGVESEHLQRWQEAATAFEESLRYSDSSPVTPQTKLQLANAYRKLRRQKDAIPILQQLADSSTDRDAQDDALELLAWCQTEMESYDDAKNTWRTLLRRFPDSHFVPEAKLALQTLTINH
jgi:tetratricopeptide (TPR) repeat protein